MDESERPYKVFRHKIGENPQQDQLVFHEEDEAYFLFIIKTRDNQYILTNHHSTRAMEMRFLSADQPEGELKILSPRKDVIEYFAAHHQGYFFVVTNDQAQNFKLMKAPIRNVIHATY